MRRRTESDRLLCAVFTWLVLLVMCWPVNAQKNVVAPINYEYELTLYRPQIALSKDGTHAVAWESLAKLVDTEEWQIGVLTFSANGSALDEPVYLRDQKSCVDEGIEGFRGVQNADIKFNAEGDVVIAMEPEVDIYNERLHKEPRTILSRLDQTGQVSFFDFENPCERESSVVPEKIESERPRFDLLPRTGEIVLVSNSQAPFGSNHKNRFRKISSVEPANSLSDSRAWGEKAYVELWHDVAASNLFSGYTWQRCNSMDNDGDTYDCDVVVKFVPHSAELNVLHTTKPIRVNAGDSPGVLNYRPSIAMNDDGESVVVWIDYRYSEAGDVWAQRFDSTGWPLGENIRISNGTGAIDIAEGVGPEVAMKDDGSYMVVWTQDDGTGRRAYGRVVSKNQQEASFLLDSDSHIESSGADVTSNGDQFAYTWISVNDKGPSVFYWVTDSELLATHNLERPEADFSFTGYPNPFSDETTLEYVLRNEGHVTLIIYDLLGREVKKLIDKWQAPGSYLVNVPAGELAMGYYVTKLQQGDLQFSKVLIRTP